MSLPNRNAVLLIIALMFVGGVLAAPGAWAQEKHKYFFKAPPGVSKYTQQHVIDVGDVAGHQIRVYELHTKYTTEAPVYDGIRVVEGWGWGSSDYTNGSGPAVSYGTAVLENGDKIFSRAEILTQTVVGPDGARKSRFNVVAALTGGTGRFKGIRGTLRTTGATDFKTGTSDVVTEGEYWIEK
jgi:hypothetical protein